MATVGVVDVVLRAARGAFAADLQKAKGDVRQFSGQAGADLKTVERFFEGIAEKAQDSARAATASARATAQAAAAAERAATGSRARDSKGRFLGSGASGADAAGIDAGKVGATTALLGAMRGKLLAVGVAAGSLLTVNAALDATVGAAIRYQSAFTGVRKTVNASEGELSSLSAEIRRMSRTDLPVASTQLAEIAASAGQLGIQTKNIGGFTRTIAQLGSATNLSYEEGASDLARFGNITQLPQDQYSNLGSAIVALGNNLATTEREIVSISLRLAGAGTTVGLTEAEVLGLGAALSSLGIEAEAGGTAVSKVLVDIAGAVRGQTKELEIFATVAGMSVEQFSELFSNNAVDALAAFTQGLADMEARGQNSFAVLESLGFNDARVRDAFLRVANSGDLLTRALTLSKHAYAENIALSEEAAARAKDTASQITLLKQTLGDMGVTLGAGITPILDGFTQGLREALNESTLLQESSANNTYPALAQTLADVAASANLAGQGIGWLTSKFIEGTAQSLNFGASLLQTASSAIAWAATSGGDAIDLARGDQSISGQAARRLLRRGMSAGDLSGSASLAGTSPLLPLPSPDLFASADSVAALMPAGEPLNVGVDAPGATGPPSEEDARAAALAARVKALLDSIDGAGAKAKRGKTAKTEQDYLQAGIDRREDLFRAQDSRLAKQQEIAGRQEHSEFKVWELQKQRYSAERKHLEWKARHLAAMDDKAGELALVEAEIANIDAELATPFDLWSDQLAEANVQAERLGNTLREDILGSIKQFAVGVAQGTARLKDFPRILQQSTAANVTSRLFDSVLGPEGLFGPGTGTGDFRAFGANLGKAFGVDAFGQILPADFTGPLQPGQFRAGTAGANFSTAGGILSTSMAGFSTGQQVAGLFGINSQESQIGGAVGSLAGSGIGFALGGPMGAAVGGFLGGTMGTFVGDLFRDRPNKDQKARGILDEAFKKGMVFGTLALAKEPFGEFKAATAPGFAAGMQDEFTALSLLVGLTGASATERGPRNLGRRAGFLGLTEEQTRQQNRQVARATGKSVAEGVNDITVAFLRYQQEGKGAEITQAEYNAMVTETVGLLQDDLPGGVDASIVALRSLEKFGDNSIVNLEKLNETLDLTAQAAAGLGSGVTSGLKAAIASNNVGDVGAAFADEFVNGFIDQVVTQALATGGLSESMEAIIGPTLEVLDLTSRGDRAGAARAQADLVNEIPDLMQRVTELAAPITETVSSLRASIGARSGTGIIRQPIVVQNIVDGRVVSESVHHAEVMGRTPGIVRPKRVG